MVSYDLGISSPRSHGIAGQPLRSPRQISLCAFSDADKPLKQVTSLLMQFGQFINHDMESTSTFTFRKSIIMHNLSLKNLILENGLYCKALPISFTS